MKLITVILKDIYKPPKNPWSLSKIMVSMASDSCAIWFSWLKPIKDLWENKDNVQRVIRIIPLLELEMV